MLKKEIRFKYKNKEYLATIKDTKKDYYLLTLFDFQLCEDTTTKIEKQNENNIEYEMCMILTYSALAKLCELDKININAYEREMVC